MTEQPDALHTGALRPTLRWLRYPLLSNATPCGGETTAAFDASSASATTSRGGALVRRACAWELKALERAEQRLAEGTYGLSVESGEPISDARLERLPAAERTADEQRAWERSGR